MTNSMIPDPNPAGQLGVDLSGKVVLIIDDEEFMLKVMKRVLVDFKAKQVYQASSGKEAMGVLKRYSTEVNLIISDCNMKPINGLELLKLVRGGANPDVARDLPFIMVTGHGDVPIVKKAVELDVSGYCVKPVAPGILAKIVKKALDEDIELKKKSFYRELKLVKPEATAFGEGNA